MFDSLKVKGINFRRIKENREEMRRKKIKNNFKINK